MGNYRVKTRKEGVKRVKYTAGASVQSALQLMGGGPHSPESQEAVDGHSSSLGWPLNVR